MSMSMRLRIRAAQAAELARLEKIGAISLEQLVRERVLLGGPYAGEGFRGHEIPIISAKGGEKSNDIQ